MSAEHHRLVKFGKMSRYGFPPSIGDYDIVQEYLMD